MDPRIQTFYDNATRLGLSLGEYAVLLLGKDAILDPIEEARQEEDES